MSANLKDAGAERSIISAILQHGEDAFIDVSGILAAKDFGIPINRAIYTCISELVEDATKPSIDIETIKVKAKAIGNLDLSDPKVIEYMELIDDNKIDRKSVEMLAVQVKKFSIAREIHIVHTEALKRLDGMSGNESIAQLIANTEGLVADYIAGTADSSVARLTEGIDNYINDLILNEAAVFEAIPTGFPLYDQAIGGGLRLPGIHVIGMRVKSGKTYDAMNKGINVSSKGTPVLFLDTELTADYQRNRMICIRSGCPISIFESKQFRDDKALTQKIVDVAVETSKMPFYHECVAGKDHHEILAIIRRWLVKVVGFRQDGKANPCLIIYDYIKLTGSEAVTSATPEWMLLGFIMSSLHNITVKYNIPVLAYVQLNREGIDGDNNNSGVISGSDRIAWLCSSLAIMRNKDQNDIDAGDGFENGNKKLIVTDCRYGPGLNLNDYINIHAAINPNTPPLKCTGLFREGFLHSKVSTAYASTRN